MNYPQSGEILEEIKKAKKILVNLHRGPDPDSYACAFALYYFLISQNKDVTIVLTNTSELSNQLKKFDDSDKVKLVDYSKIDFSKYDLFISPDSGSLQQIVDNPEIKVLDIKIIVIDHHASNDKFGKINLIDSSAVSCSQIIYLIFKDWDFFIDSKMASLLMFGIIADSGVFAFSNDSKVMKIAGELMELGANKEKIINDFFRTKPFSLIKSFGEFLSRMEFDKEHKFVWTAISYEDYLKLKIPPKAASVFATDYASIVDGSDFGLIMCEDEKNKLKISFRSRSNIDVSKLAEQLNGGGHKKAAGGQIEGMKFEEAVNKVLEVARKFADESK
ncbi:MAG TPA: DHH family phosphoesterase [Patescibacteria group bacterium]|nr:DHH family phosphoesterase [Patescibacteria group bacterium]